MHDSIVTSFFLIFSGAALLATLALVGRQPLLVAYIVLGALIGPDGAGWLDDPALVSSMSEIGIIFLLFLLGLDLEPRSLLSLLGETLLLSLGSTLAFGAVGFTVAWLFGFPLFESLLVGVAMTFSSTIIGIKLLPTTVLHHKRTGELVISLLLLQDLIAILVLILLLGGQPAPLMPMAGTAGIFLALPLLVAVAFLGVRHLILPLLARYDRFHEYIFLLSLGWCLGLAALASGLGLSMEIGAFVAGISIATSPIAQYIATSLRPLRDFFLVLFFVSLGAGFNLDMLGAVWLPALVMTAVMLAIKPPVFAGLLRLVGEERDRAMEVGVRLGQVSEFSLLIAFLATTRGLMGEQAAHLIQATAILAFVLNTYLVITRYPSPIALSDRLRRD